VRIPRGDRISENHAAGKSARFSQSSIAGSIETETGESE
jgi:hypothetical protein